MEYEIWLTLMKLSKTTPICTWLSSFSVALQQLVSQIKPTDFVERLPRDLEKHYDKLKATEF